LYSLHFSGERAGTEVAVALKFLEKLNDKWRRRRRKFTQADFQC